MCELSSELLKIPDMNKTGLTGIPDMAREGKIQVEPNTQVPIHVSR